jgi:aminopeptidase N
MFQAGELGLCVTTATRKARYITAISRTSGRAAAGSVTDMASLTRSEAEERATRIRVHTYRVSLDLRDTGSEFISDTVMTFSCAPTGAATFVDVKAVSIVQASLNGRLLDGAALSDGRLPLHNLAAENELRIIARMAYSSDGEGLHRHVDPADDEVYLYAMSFLDAAPRWFACFDQPDLKATYSVQVQCPTDWTVLGNGAASQHAPGQWTLAMTKPLSTYFVTLVAGPYRSMTAQHDGIRLGVHARASLAEHLAAEAPDMLEVTRAAFDRYHELFGVRYPFGEYHQAFVPDFNAGAMENPGCVTLRDQYVFRSAATVGERGTRARTIVHEMAHMWFGDLVTMRWWDDLWLNESFAEYMGQRVSSEVTRYDAWTDFGIHRKDWGAIADQAPSTHPIAGNGSADAAAALADFDGISYAKGASALKQLAAYLGDDIFFAGLRSYFAKHAFGNAEFSDLIEAWNEAGAQDLPRWAAQWLRTSGMDTLSAQARDGAVVLNRLSPDQGRRPHTIRVAGFDAGGHQVLDQPVTLLEDEVRLVAPASVQLVVADGADDTWAKVRVGRQGWGEVARILPVMTNQASRVVLYNAVRDAMRDADLDPADALAILLGGLATETDDRVLAEILRFATVQLVGQFTPIPERAARNAQISAFASDLLRLSKSGSDTQLETARALIRSTDDASVLHAWLSGSQVPEGLAVDAELRWSLIGRLSALGAASTNDIDLELAGDNSTSGVVHAARARAARPDPAAKDLAWRLLTEPSNVPAYELYATAEAFFQPHQTELTADYLPRFFVEIPATVSFRRGWALGRIALLAYPTSCASADVLDLADQTLSRDDLDGGVRRSLVDGTDVLRRAIASARRHSPS